ncbi:MAG: helix-turn-helix domain-containing protein [Oscillospiraceae bacterium]|jgi:transcriptional regulator with XRE-family HTH domain|nr:helix-turn-helix domain-containing protein [Oscillospiraceae bacterium]
MFAQRLKQLRELKNISQTRLAREMGVTQGTVGNWETGKRTPDTGTLQRLADYFSVSVDFLLGHDTDNPEIVLLARHLAFVPETDRRFLLETFRDTIDNYLKAKGL